MTRENLSTSSRKLSPGCVLTKVLLECLQADLVGVILGRQNDIDGLVAMAKDIKTRPTGASVVEFLNSVADDRRRADALKVLETFRRVTGEEAVMWGPAIVGFGSRVIRYADGSELDWPVAAFSPRKASLTLYLICDSPNQPKLLAKLGKHTSSVACLYIKKLSDVDEKVLEELIADSVRHVRSRGQ